MKPLFLLLPLALILSGCEGEHSPTFDQTSAHFTTFQSQSAKAPDHSVVVNYRLASDANGHIEADVNTNAWMKLSHSQRLALIKTLQQRWAAINSPGNTSNSTITLLSGGHDVAHAAFNKSGQWELTAQ